jgi:hypothetical protein
MVAVLVAGTISPPIASCTQSFLWQLEQETGSPGIGEVSMVAILVALQGIAGPAECAAGRTDQPAGQRVLRLDVSLNRVYNSANVLKTPL